MEYTEMIPYTDPAGPAAREPDRSFAGVLALIVGLLAVLAAGGSISGDVADLLPLVSAAAVPGLVALILTCLSAGAEMTEDIPEVAELG